MEKPRKERKKKDKDEKKIWKTRDRGEKEMKMFSRWEKIKG